MKREGFRPWIAIITLLAVVLLVGVPVALGPRRAPGPLGPGPYTSERAGLRRMGLQPSPGRTGGGTDLVPTPRGAAPTRPVPSTATDPADLRMAITRTREAVNRRDWVRAEGEVARLGLIWRGIRPRLSGLPARAGSLAAFETAYRAVRLDVQDRNFSRSRYGLETLDRLAARF